MHLYKGLVIEVKELLNYIQIHFPTAFSHTEETAALFNRKGLYATIKITFIVTYHSLWMFRKQNGMDKLISVQVAG